MKNNFTQINCDSFKQELETGDYTLVDLRTQDELDRHGTISKNQIHIDVYQPFAALKILKLERNKKYLLYCWHGVRSDNIRNFMQENKFLYVNDLEGGIDVWNKIK